MAVNSAVLFIGAVALFCHFAAVEGCCDDRSSHSGEMEMPLLGKKGRRRAPSDSSDDSDNGRGGKRPCIKGGGYTFATQNGNILNRYECRKAGCKWVVVGRDYAPIYGCVRR